MTTVGKRSELKGRDAEAPRPVVLPRLLGLYRLKGDLISAPEYCGISATHFEKHCPLKPIRIGARRLWDVRALDVWIDKLGSQIDMRKDDGAAIEADATDKAIGALRRRNAETKNKKPRRRPEARSI